MSSGNRDCVFGRLFKQWASVCKLLVDLKRDADTVSEVLQNVIDGVPLLEPQYTPQQALMKRIEQDTMIRQGEAEDKVSMLIRDLHLLFGVEGNTCLETTKIPENPQGWNWEWIVSTLVRRYVDLEAVATEITQIMKVRTAPQDFGGPIKVSGDALRFPADSKPMLGELAHAVRLALQKE